MLILLLLELHFEQHLSRFNCDLCVGVICENTHSCMSVIAKIKSLKINPQYLVKQVEGIYEKYSQDIKEDFSEKLLEP